VMSYISSEVIQHGVSTGPFVRGAAPRFMFEVGREVGRLLNMLTRALYENVYHGNAHRWIRE
jgi:hypothetical protein